jgi:hypothetical protein
MEGIILFQECLTIIVEQKLVVIQIKIINSFWEMLEGFQVLVKIWGLIKDKFLEFWIKIQLIMLLILITKTCKIKEYLFKVREKFNKIKILISIKYHNNILTLKEDLFSQPNF